MQRFRFRHHRNGIVQQNSGTDADFVWLLADVTNLGSEDARFMKDATVKYIYDETYEFGGWVRQLNYNYENATGEIGSILPKDEENVGMMYTGHYVWGCTLPNEVVKNTSATLRMEVDLGGNTLIYHLRRAEDLIPEA